MKTNIHINSKYNVLEEFVLSIPSIFDNSGQVLYRGRNIIKKYHYRGFEINVKSFKIPSFINKFAYCYLRDSKAKRSYNHALYLKEQGIGTPDPIACIEIFKGSLFDKSYYISIHENTDGSIRDIFDYGSQTKNQALVADFIVFTASLHKKKILHKDYSPGNILYRKETDGYHFLLVDLNRMKLNSCNIISGCKSFRRLKLDKEDVLYISVLYSRMCGYNKKLCFLLICLYNTLFWKIYLVRHPEIKRQAVEN